MSQGVVGVDRHLHPRCVMADDGAFLTQLPKPTALQPGLLLGGAAVAREQDGGASLGSPDGQHIPSMRVRCSLLGQQVVTVVPQCDEPEVADGRKRGGAVTYDDWHITPKRSQKRAIAGRWAGFGNEHTEASSS